MIDQTKISPDLLKKLQVFEENKPVYKQLRALEDIADMTQELLGLIEDGKKSGATNADKFGSLMVDIRESLGALKDKKDPEFPDYAKPVVEAVKDLETNFTAAIKALDLKPNVKVAAPDVKVQSPDVKVDLGGVEKALKTEVPKAFKEAIKLIPKTEIPEDIDYRDRWDAMLEKLESIDTATRMKPQSPSSVEVSNLSDVSSSFVDDDGAEASGLVDDDGHIQVDVLTSALPSGATTAANQATAIAHLDDIATSLDNRYGGGKTAVNFTVTASGDTTILTPASGKAVRLYSISALTDPDEATTPLIKVLIGSTEVRRGHAIGGWEISEGAADEVLKINLSGASSVSGTAFIKEFDP